MRASQAPFLERPLGWPTHVLPVPADLIVYTADEWRQLHDAGGRFARTLAREAVWLIGCHSAADALSSAAVAMWHALIDPRKLALPRPDEALPGRAERMRVAARHVVTGAPLEPPFPAGMERAVFGMGCFWGAERMMWEAPGVQVTAVGYAGGVTPNPTYAEVCSGRTGHAEVVLVVFDPARGGYERLLRLFWEGHDPTQGMRQGNDVGTQYRSAICCATDAQRQVAEASRDAYAQALADADCEPITTEILLAGEFYYAEDHHQQYLAKNPGGYCGLGGTGVSCPADPGARP